MALLTLKDIGKIYVSEGNVSVGIRGVNLSFDRGEFVAVTGKSGSGKSTLLNVISGMDSYEEGELYIEGQTTSHYLQPEWEEYRQKYISFIFQDYNIIESFTVLQNVELALMHIEDKKERRRRALELIERVGLSSHVKHKGSKLSGGQKQRTVIARALAKDSPIILADEPTGNLDSATSREIIELLREVSKDKLLIVVTHNFEQVEEYATRHIRIFDGAVESDRVISRSEIKESAERTKSVGAKSNKALFKNGLTLGRSIFTSKPKLSVFLCFLMIVGTLGVFFITSLCGEAGDMFDKNYMFNHIDGRLVIAKQSGEAITDSELESLAAELGAQSTLHYDILLDEGRNNHVTFYDGESGATRAISLECVYGENFGDDILGSYPKGEDEVFLYLPIYLQDVFGKDELLTDRVIFNSTEFKVTGVKYFYDNNLKGKMLFTQSGFRTATAVHYIMRNGEVNINVKLEDTERGTARNNIYRSLMTSFDAEAGKIYIDGKEYRNTIDRAQDPSRYSTEVVFNSTYYKYNYYYHDGSDQINFAKEFGNDRITQTKPKLSSFAERYYTDGAVVMHPSVLVEIAEDVLAESYTQASLFFENDKEVHAAVSALRDKGYIAIPSDTTYSPDASTVISNMVLCVMMALLWLLAIIFIAFFINLCSGRTLGAFKGDMAIMRSMGIPVRVIRVGIYVRMFISLIPALLVMITAAVVIFRTPSLNMYFEYLYAWQYALIFIGMILLTFRVTYRQIKKLFRESVKKSLKGGASE